VVRTYRRARHVYGIRFGLSALKVADVKSAASKPVNVLWSNRGAQKIIKGSPLEKQDRGLQWKPDDFGNSREDKAQANHSRNCLIYGRRLVAHLFEMRLGSPPIARPQVGGVR